MNRVQEIKNQILKLEDELEEEVTTFIRINGVAQKIVADLWIGKGKYVYQEGKMVWVPVIPVIGIVEAKKK